mgnify:CR=1 FL=1
MKDIKIKNFTNELSTIEHFESYKKQKVIIENCDGEAFITKLKRDFQLSFEGIFNYKSDKKIKVNINDKEFTFKSVDFKEPIDEIFSNVSTNFTADLETSFLKINTANFISNNLLRRDFANDVINEIISLNENGRQDDSMKEIYTFFDEFLKDDNIEIIDYIFSLNTLNSFPYPLLVY